MIVPLFVVVEVDGTEDDLHAEALAVEAVKGLDVKSDDGEVAIRYRSLIGPLAGA